MPSSILRVITKLTGPTGAISHRVSARPYALRSRISSLVLFVFTLATIYFFHNQVGDPQAVQLALRDLAIAGGLLMVFAYGQASGSVDMWRDRDRARRAELRSARAQARSAEAES